MESMMEIVATFMAICMLGVTFAVFGLLWVIYNLMRSRVSSQIQMETDDCTDPPFDNLSKPLDILSKHPNSEDDDAVPFNAEEALSEMNEWERSLCAKQQAAWEILNPGKAWKMTPYVYKQIKRAAMRRIA